MEVKHDNIFVSKIRKKGLDILFELWQEYADKNSFEKNDRAKNITYEISRLGRVTVSYSTATITIYTNHNFEYVKKFFRGLLGKKDFKVFKKKLTYKDGGAHFVKCHGAVGYQIDVKKPCIISLWLIARKCKNYGDLHFSLKFPLDAVVVKDFSKGSASMASIPPPKKYVTYDEIRKLAKKNGGTICLNDAKTLGISKSSLCRRLKTYYKRGRINKIENYPVFYVLK